MGTCASARLASPVPLLPDDDGEMTVDLAVGDPVRRDLGRAVLGGLALGCAFWLVTGLAKEIPALYAPQPWREDPYDALVSFDLVAVPVLVAASAVRVALCRRAEPLPVVRGQDLLRASAVLLGLMTLTLAAEWAAVLLDPLGLPSTGISRAEVGVLAALSVAALVAWAAWRTAARRAPSARAGPGPDPDWLADALTLGRRTAGRLGPLAVPGRRLVDAVDHLVVARVRARPLAAAAVFSLAAGAALDVPKVVLEGYPPTLLAVVLVVETESMFAFVVLTGVAVRLTGRPRGRTSVGVSAVLAACAAGPVAAAFRADLWWLLGTTDARAGIRELGLLVVVASLVAAAVAVGAHVVVPALGRGIVSVTGRRRPHRG